MTSNPVNVGALVAFNLLATRRMFLGKVTGYDGSTLSLTRVLVVEPVKQGNEIQLMVAPMEFAKRDSGIVFDLKNLPGFIVTDLDDETKQLYDSKIISAYSALTLA